MPILTPEERVGTTIADKYKLERILGEGGFGVVLGGTHEWTGRPIAVKILDHTLSRKKSFVGRFLREARAAAKLEHPNVVDVLDMGRDDDGTVYLVLEFLKGEDFASALERTPKPGLERTLEYTMPIMDALASAHGRDIVHRDLKPANIFLSRDGRNQLVPKLLDFGIAKDASDEGVSTRTGEVWGTPHYMSPEQALGSSDIGPPTDVWAMGVVLYECLAGALPYQSPSVATLLAALLAGPPRSIREVAPDVPEPMARIVTRALAHDASERYPDLGAMLSDVIEAAEQLDCMPANAAPIVLAARLEKGSTVANAALPEAPEPADPEPPSGEAPIAATPVETRALPAVVKTQPTPTMHPSVERSSSGPPWPVVAAGVVLTLFVLVTAAVVGLSSSDSDTVGDLTPAEAPDRPAASAVDPPSDGPDELGTTPPSAPSVPVPPGPPPAEAEPTEAEPTEAEPTEAEPTEEDTEAQAAEPAPTVTPRAGRRARRARRSRRSPSTDRPSSNPFDF